MSAAALLAVAAFLGLLGLLGSRLAACLAAPEDGALYRGTLYTMAGAVALHLLLTALDFAGLPWNPLFLGALGLGLYGLGWRFLPRGPGPTGLPADFGWGEATALFALTAFTLIALTGWITQPDFFFHWGLKGSRFFLARGVDYPYLARRWNWVLHPDYPNLLPELYAVPALMVGRFDAPALMLEAGALFALLLAAVREGLRQGTGDRFVRQAGLALVALAVGAFGIGYRMAGGADWMIALALAAAVPPLLRPADRTGDVQIGVLAAFAAGSKMEGVPLAAFLILAQWARHVLRERRPAVGAALRAGLPAAAVVLPWLGRTLHHHLFLALNTGPFTPSRATAILAATLEGLRTPEWHGFLWTVLLPPLLLVHRRARPFAAVATLELGFFFYVYFTSASAAQTRLFLLSNFARLGLQIVPAALVMGLLAWGPGEENRDLSGA